MLEKIGNALIKASKKRKDRDRKLWKYSTPRSQVAEDVVGSNLLYKAATRIHAELRALADVYQNKILSFEQRVIQTEFEKGYKDCCFAILQREEHLEPSASSEVVKIYRKVEGYENLVAVYQDIVSHGMYGFNPYESGVQMAAAKIILAQRGVDPLDDLLSKKGRELCETDCL